MAAVFQEPPVGPVQVRLVAEARDGICTICHVRLRPQVFNDVRRNEAIVQCESCQRILYYVPAPASQSQAS